MKTCLFKYTGNLTTKKKNDYFQINLIFFMFLLKTLNVGTCSNCLNEAVLMSAHNLYFEQK